MAKKYDKELILNGSMSRAILSITIPIIINSFLQTMYNLTATFWMGRLGTEQLAAINLVSPVQSIVVSFGGGITVAGAIIISQYIGAKRMDKANEIANQIYACAIIFSVVCSVLVYFLTPNIVSWLGADGNVHEFSRVYMQTVIFHIPFLYTVNIYAAMHQAQGDTVRPMFLNLSGIVLNMILIPILMFRLNLGVMGAALSTLIANVVPACYAFFSLSQKSQAIFLNLKKLRFIKEDLKKIAYIGLPTAVGGSTMQFGFLLMSRNVFAYGQNAMAAYGIGNKVNGLISLPSNGIGSATATIVGQNVGAGQYSRAQNCYKISRRMATIFLFLGGLILSRMSISTAIVSIFSEDEAVIALAADFLSILAFYAWSNGIYNSTTGLFQGSGHTEITTIVDVTRLWVFRFAVLYICEQWLQMGVRSIWYCIIVSNFISAGILLIVYKTGYWKKRRI